MSKETLPLSFHPFVNYTRTTVVLFTQDDHSRSALRATDPREVDGRLSLTQESLEGVLCGDLTLLALSDSERLRRGIRTFLVLRRDDRPLIYRLILGRLYQDLYRFPSETKGICTYR